METSAARHHRPPFVLIINDQEWSTRSLESILAPHGYAVLRAYTGSKGFERAVTARPDVIVTGAVLPDLNGAVPAAPCGSPDHRQHSYPYHVHRSRHAQGAAGCASGRRVGLPRTPTRR